MTLIQFEDLGCSHCAEYMKDAFPTIVNDYVRTGLVKVDFRGLGVVTRASAPALRYTLAASRQKKLWQVAELFYENQSRLNELATDAGVKRMVVGVKGLDAKLLVADSKTLSVKKQVAAHAAEATRRKVPGTPWFFIKVGTAPPKVVRPRRTTASRSARSSTTHSAGERQAPAGRTARRLGRRHRGLRRISPTSTTSRLR